MGLEFIDTVHHRIGQGFGRGGIGIQLWCNGQYRRLRCNIYIQLCCRRRQVTGINGDITKTATFMNIRH
ncbi:hypothetical protein SDC9_188265 [bioreactor metagenome]|uniref:Uncharacterized protein n=1 Tax=bioreactor metagenome TaxID=1076179 RepID=A0A645HQA1_9ZZZZ